MRILHVLRAPVGGLFRHVRDLAKAQTAHGHEVAILCDSLASDRLTEQRLGELEPHLALGLHRCTMPRVFGASDTTAVARTRTLIGTHRFDIVHGHGAKGGAYARSAAALSKANAQAFYTPHGGSLHYDPKTAKGRVFMGMERRLARATAGAIFESQYSRSIYRQKVGADLCPERVIHNGLLREEFTTHTPAPDASDVVFIGELRHLKGVDVLLHALADSETASGRPATATIVGDGPDAAGFKALAAQLRLDDRVSFTGAMPATKAFGLGRCLAVPSRAESFPYIVLEAAAQSVPLIATDVGGSGEIVAGTSTTLIAPDSVPALSRALQQIAHDPEGAKARARALQEHARAAFSVEQMTRNVLDFYETALV